MSKFENSVQELEGDDFIKQSYYLLDLNAALVRYRLW
jgi:hypothetical protein